MADDKSPFPKLDFVLKAAATITVVVSTIVAVFSYLDTREKEALARVADAQVKAKEADARVAEALSAFRRARMERYTEIVAVVSKLAASRSDCAMPGQEKEPCLTPAEAKAAERRFYEMYWGDLSLVESEAIKVTMQSLAGALHRSEDVPVRNFAYRIAHLARQGLIDEYKMDASKLNLSKSPDDLVELQRKLMVAADGK